jgi:hypothetical protein
MEKGGKRAWEAVGGWYDGALLGYGGHGGDIITVLKCNLKWTFDGGMLVSSRGYFRYIDEGMSP